VPQIRIPGITIIFNPVAGNRRRVLMDRVADRLSAQGWQVTLVSTSGPGNATELASEAVRSGAGMIGAAGGDGTIREIIAGVGDSPVPIAILPMGTANVLALEFGLGKTADAIVKTIAGAETRQLHLPAANGKPFCLMIGAGFDGEIVHAITSPMKKRWGKGAFAWQGLKALARFSNYDIRVSENGREVRGRWVVVTNISRYGGPVMLDRESEAADCELAAHVFAPASRMQFAFDLVRLGLGRLTRSRHVTVIRGRNFRIEAADNAIVPVQIDGDAVGHLPLSVDATDRSVGILVTPDA
jgi:diacylglycerol kinase (ATP)